MKMVLMKIHLLDILILEIIYLLEVEDYLQAGMIYKLKNVRIELAIVQHGL